MSIDELEKHAVLQSPSRIAALVKIFTEATRVRVPSPSVPRNISAYRSANVLTS